MCLTLTVDDQIHFVMVLHVAGFVKLKFTMTQLT